MGDAHGFDQPGILDRIGSGAPVFLQEDVDQQPDHEGCAAQVQPDPSQWKAFRMNHGHDVEGHVEEVHDPGPGSQRYHDQRRALGIDPDHRQEREEEMSEDDEEEKGEHEDEEEEKGLCSS